MGKKRDRARGALLGLAVGDAIGTTVEFKEPGEFDPLTDMVGGGVFRLQPGEWTDDTSMALCLADTLIEKGTVDHNDLLTRFARWYNQGENSSNGKCFDIGTTCVGAIVAFQRNKAYQPAPNHSWLSGNGSIMRLAPVPIRWFREPEVAREMAREQSLTTHGSTECLESCERLSDIITGLIRGEEVDVDVVNLLGEKVHKIPNTGYVMHTMTAAMWAYVNANNFDDCVLMAANLGGDADTIAAVAGQIAGAKWGMSSIRPEWLEKLAQRDHLIELADKLFDAGKPSLDS